MGQAEENRKTSCPGLAPGTGKVFFFGNMQKKKKKKSYNNVRLPYLSLAEAETEGYAGPAPLGLLTLA